MRADWLVAIPSADALEAHGWAALRYPPNPPLNAPEHSRSFPEWLMLMPQADRLELLRVV